MGGNNIRDLIRILAHGEDFFEPMGVPCKVKSVDTANGVVECDPVNGDAPFIECRLQADPGSGILIIPKVGSVVIVQPINETTGYIAMFSKAESVKLLDGSYGGLIKITQLVDKVNTLENQVNSLLSSLQGVVVPLAPSGTYPFAPLFTQTPLTNTVAGDIENPDITHGKPDV